MQSRGFFLHAVQEKAAALQQLTADSELSAEAIEEAEEPRALPVAMAAEEPVVDWLLATSSKCTGPKRQLS